MRLSSRERPPPEEEREISRQRRVVVGDRRRRTSNRRGKERIREEEPEWERELDEEGETEEQEFIPKKARIPWTTTTRSAVISNISSTAFGMRLMRAGEESITSISLEDLRNGWAMLIATNATGENTTTMRIANKFVATLTIMSVMSIRADFQIIMGTVVSSTSPAGTRKIGVLPKFRRTSAVIGRERRGKRPASVNVATIYVDESIKYPRIMLLRGMLTPTAQSPIQKTKLKTVKRTVLNSGDSIWVYAQMLRTSLTEENFDELGDLSEPSFLVQIVNNGVKME